MPFTFHLHQVCHKDMQYTQNSGLIVQITTQCTGLTSGSIVYPYIQAPYGTIRIKYVTVEDSCYATLRVAVEIHSSRILSSSSLVR